MTIGDPVAENEFSTLRDYFLRTDPFERASRGEINLVVGRKGSGKTALFSQLRDEKRGNPQNIVVDLKPEGYQLLRLKEDVLQFLSDGARTHLITAFFEYVIYLEVCYKVLEKDKDRHVRDSTLYGPYRELSDTYSTDGVAEGDFSERLNSLSLNLRDRFRQQYGDGENLRLTEGQVTELVYKHNISKIRMRLSKYLSFKKNVWLLFDNLDKGWSSHGLSDSDVLILRGLVDAARKIQRNFRREGRDFYCIAFVRSDVYQLLVRASPDYGKESRATLDWTDSDLLRELIRRRIVQNIVADDILFEDIWPQFCVTHHLGEDTSQYLIERSLMRPRNLLKILTHCRGYAVNLRHSRIEASDIDKGLIAYSRDLITEANQELTDIVGEQTDIIYHFIGEGSIFTYEKVLRILGGAATGESSAEQIVDFLVYYGFIGIKIDNNEDRFIFNVGYDIEALRVLIKKHHKVIRYVLNPAFYPGLNL